VFCGLGSALAGGLCWRNCWFLITCLRTGGWVIIIGGGVFSVFLFLIFLRRTIKIMAATTSTRIINIIITVFLENKLLSILQVCVSGRFPSSVPQSFRSVQTLV